MEPCTRHRPQPLLPATTFVVVDTHYVVPKHEPPVLRLVLGADQSADTPHVTLVTLDPVIYVRAIELEGTDQRVTVTWRDQRGPCCPRLVLSRRTTAAARPAIFDEWRSYDRDVVPSAASAIQREECRRAFYAGAWACSAR